jgi:phosphoglucosamine mutase
MVLAKQSFPRELNLEGIKIVLDCANGATYRLAPDIFAELGAEVITQGDQPNGVNINDQCGALYPEKMCRRVLQECADIGVALDGDGDRVVLCDEAGILLNGDHLMYITASHWHAHGRLCKAGIVATQMSNLGLKIGLRGKGIAVHEAEVGDRYVAEAMRRGGYNVGGEQSGHLIFLDHTTTGDGIISALQVLAVMLETRQPLSKLRAELSVVPQVLRNVEVREKRPLAAMPKVQEAIRSIEKNLNGDGRIYVRYSGTEPLARVMIEGTDQQKIEMYAKQVANEIEQEVGLAR